MSRKERLHQLISATIPAELLVIEDESHRHNVPKGAESHFKLTMVSERFQMMKRIQRHQLINACVRAEFAGGLHALSMHLFTPDEWAYRQKTTAQSPACRNGSRHDKQ